MSEAGERMGRGLGRMLGRDCGKPPPGRQTGGKLFQAENQHASRLGGSEAGVAMASRRWASKTHSRGWDALELGREPRPRIRRALGSWLQSPDFILWLLQVPRNNNKLRVCYLGHFSLRKLYSPFVQLVKQEVYSYILVSFRNKT